MLVKLTFHNMKKNEVNFALGKAKSAYFKNLLNENKNYLENFGRLWKRFTRWNQGGVAMRKTLIKKSPPRYATW